MVRSHLLEKIFSTARWFFPLLAIAAIMVAVVVLGYYSYHAASRIAARSEESLEKSNRVVGQKLIDRIEKMIIDSDMTLFRMVRLDDPKEFQELWRRIVRISPVVETVVVLDQERKVVHLVSKLGKSALSHFRELFEKSIVLDMGLPLLPPDAHRHLHKSYEGIPYLISYFRRSDRGQDYYIALNINLPYITKEIFSEEFRELQEAKFIAVLDEEGLVVYGHPAVEQGSFVFEERFPTTLYRWRLQLAPKEVAFLRREVKTRRTVNIALVATADGLILIGMLVLLIAARKERRANRLKSEFISNVTHELKTPLSLIHMFGELLALRRATSDETAREYAEIITRESDRLARLIDNVLDFARIERGKAAYEFSQGSLTTVVERAVDLVRYRAEQAGIRLQTSIEPDLPDTRLDENAMTLLLLNLLENALKYGAKEEAEIRVSLNRQRKALVLRVSDQGPGIPREELSRIFDRFYRGKNVRARPSRGSGIGLSLVKHIAEGHGGQVRVESALGKGTTFEVSIPLQEG